MTWWQILIIIVVAWLVVGSTIVLTLAITLGIRQSRQFDRMTDELDTHGRWTP